MSEPQIHQLNKPDSHNHGKWYVQWIRDGEETVYLKRDDSWEVAAPDDQGYFDTKEEAEEALAWSNRDHAFPLTLTKCYVGHWWVEVMPYSPRIHEEGAGLYLQFKEGCGYTPFSITPDEADRLADLLKAGAAQARRAYKNI
jgi:hypothetical protein